MKTQNISNFNIPVNNSMSFQGYAYKTSSIGIGRLANTPTIVSYKFTDDIFHKKLREKAFLKKVVRELKAKLKETKEQFEALGYFNKLRQKKEFTKSIDTQELKLEDTKGRVASIRDIAQKSRQKLQQELFVHNHSGYTVFTPGEQGLSTTYKLELKKGETDELLVSVHSTKLPHSDIFEDEILEKAQSLKEHVFNIIYNFDLIHSLPAFSSAKTVKILDPSGEYKRFCTDHVYKYIALKEEQLLNKFDTIESIPIQEIPISYQKRF